MAPTLELHTKSDKQQRAHSETASSYSTAAVSSVWVIHQYWGDLYEYGVGVLSASCCDGDGLTDIGEAGNLKRTASYAIEHGQCHSCAVVGSV